MKRIIFLVLCSLAVFNVQSKATDFKEIVDSAQTRVETTDSTVTDTTKASGIKKKATSTKTMSATGIVAPRALPDYNDSMKVSVTYVTGSGFKAHFSNALDFLPGIVGKITCSDGGNTNYTIFPDIIILPAENKRVSDIDIPYFKAYNTGMKGALFTFYDQDGNIIAKRTIILKGGDPFNYCSNVTLMQVETQPNHYTFKLYSPLLPGQAYIPKVDCKVGNISVANYPIANEYGVDLSCLKLPEVIADPYIDKQVDFYLYYWDGNVICSSVRSYVIPKEKRYWKTSGNDVCNSDEFIGPTNGQALVIKTKDGNNTLSEKMRINANGNVGIGTNNPQYPLDVTGNASIGSSLKVGGKLVVAGNILTPDIKVTQTLQWPDYVFDTDYKLKNISELEASIKKDGKLPGMPSAADVAKNGASVSEMQVKMLEKIEELTLYMIKLNKENEELKKQIQSLSK